MRGGPFTAHCICCPFFFMQLLITCHSATVMAQDLLAGSPSYPFHRLRPSPTPHFVLVSFGVRSLVKQRTVWFSLLQRDALPPKPCVRTGTRSKLRQRYSPFPEHNMPSADSHKLLLCSSVMLHLRGCWQSVPNQPLSHTQRPQEHVP